MSFLTDPNTVVLHKDEGPSLTFKGRQRITFKLTGKNTRNQFGLYEVEMSPKAMGASPHVHHQMTEIFYVLDGQLQLLAGEERVVGRPGSLISVPPEVVHAFANIDSEPVKLLILFCPALEREKFFEGIYELTKHGGPPAPELMAELERRFDQTSVRGLVFP